MTAATLHLRPGDDLRERLPRAGIAGEYLCFADPVCAGPAEDDGALPGWLDRRARFVAAHAGADPLVVRLRLGREYAALHELHRHPAVWLWFEHDLWDQAALIRVLSLLAPGRRDLAGRLWLVPADGLLSFPELADAELAALRPAPLTDRQWAEAAEAWAGFAAPDPRALDAFSRRGLDPCRPGHGRADRGPAGLEPAVHALGVSTQGDRGLALPFLGAAMRRHLRDLPWTTDGLAETERLVLLALRAAGTTEEAALLRALRAADPVFHPTDLILRDVLRRLRGGPQPLAVGSGPTEHGLAVLEGQRRHRPSPRAQGGVAVLPDPSWLWDPERGGVVAGRS